MANHHIKNKDAEISRAIVDTYSQKLQSSLLSDIIIVGAGPSGMVAARKLAENGLKTTIVEKRLAPGGGIWGGGMTMNVAVVEENALRILESYGIQYSEFKNGLYTVDTNELAAGLCFHAVQAGATILNAVTAEDICLHENKVTGVVVNRSMIAGNLPVDPLTLSSKAVIDGTGHEAVMVHAVRKRGLLKDSLGETLKGEGGMDADSGEKFVVEQAGEVFPGLWLSGMSVCAALGGPRMGPIFGGMLLSGERVADDIIDKIW